MQRQLKKDRSASGTEKGKDQAREDYKSIPDALRRIYLEEGGLSAFYSGCTQDTLKSMVDSFLFFLAYNFTRNSRLTKHSKPDGSVARKLPLHEELAVGMVSGAFSKFFTTPVQQIVTRKQIATMTGSSTKQSSWEIARGIREQKGIAGFWSGYSASLVLTLNPSLTMLFHETLLRVLVKRDERGHPGAKITFLVAAMSKALASMITYPFSLAKSRAQVSVKRPLDDEHGDRFSKNDSAKEVKNKTARKVKKDTIFESVYQIANEEGIAGLYQGLSGEVLKGFFSHGLTMLMKESIHKLVIQLYYFILKAVRRYPSPEELAHAANEKIGEAKEAVVEAASDAKDKIVEVAGGAKDALNSTVNTSEKDGWMKAPDQLLSKTVEHATELYKKGTEDILWSRREAADFLDDYIPEFDDDDNGWGW